MSYNCTIIRDMRRPMVPQTLKLLFSSGIRVELLSHFFGHPGESPHLRQLASEIGKSAGTVRRELQNLERAGVLVSQRVGNQKHYSLEHDCPVLEDLRQLFLKTTGAGEAVRTALAGLDGVELAFIYGSFADGSAHPGSDIDVMVIGRTPERALAPAISRVERAVGRQVNYVLYPRSEAAGKARDTGSFVYQALHTPRILLVGNPDDRLLAAH